MSRVKVDRMFDEAAEIAFRLEYGYLIDTLEPEVLELLETCFTAAFISGAIFTNDNLAVIDELLNEGDN